MPGIASVLLSKTFDSNFCESLSPENEGVLYQQHQVSFLQQHDRNFNPVPGTSTKILWSVDATSSHDLRNDTKIGTQRVGTSRAVPTLHRSVLRDSTSFFYKKPPTQKSFLSCISSPADQTTRQNEQMARIQDGNNKGFLRYNCYSSGMKTNFIHSDDISHGKGIIMGSKHQGSVVHSSSFLDDDAGDHVEGDEKNIDNALTNIDENSAQKAIAKENDDSSSDNSTSVDMGQLETVGGDTKVKNVSSKPPQDSVETIKDNVVEKADNMPSSKGILSSDKEDEQVVSDENNIKDSGDQNEESPQETLPSAYAGEDTLKSTDEMQVQTKKDPLNMDDDDYDSAGNDANIDSNITNNDRGEKCVNKAVQRLDICTNSTFNKSKAAAGGGPDKFLDLPEDDNTKELDTKSNARLDEGLQAWALAASSAKDNRQCGWNGLLDKEATTSAPAHDPEKCANTMMEQTDAFSPPNELKPEDSIE